MNIANKIKQLRASAGLTQEQLANRLGISAQSISKWETGVTMPDITLLPALSGELGVTIDDLFDLSVNQKMQRIERRLDIEEEFTSDAFYEYESFLKAQLDEKTDRRKVLSLLAHLYHHRMDPTPERSANTLVRRFCLPPRSRTANGSCKRQRAQSRGIGTSITAHPSLNFTSVSSKTTI